MIHFVTRVIYHQKEIKCIKHWAYNASVFLIYEPDYIYPASITVINVFIN